MFEHSDLQLMLVSVIASSAVVFICFSFVKRLHLSTHVAQNVLLPIYTTALGIAIWANQLLLSLSFHPHASQFLPKMALAGIPSSLIISLGLLFISSRNHSKFWHFMAFGFVASIFGFAIFNANIRTLHAIEEYHLDKSAMFIGTAISGIIITMVSMLFYWIRSYAGKFTNQIKMLLAVAISLSTLAIHVVYESGIIHSADITSPHTNENIIQLSGLAIGLGMMCLFMMMFIFTLLFEKHGMQLFVFNFFQANKSSKETQNAALDSLTQLPNRAAFKHYLDSAAKRSTRSGTTFALAYIDLDHFKPINDQYGHQVGDVVLTMVAERLNAAIRGCDFVARIGGDEFVAIFEQIDSDEDISPIADRIVQSIKEPMSIGNFQIEISCSMGIATYPKDGDLQKLTVCADAAMYKAKENGKNQFRFYDAEIESASDMMLELQSELYLALKNNEFSLVFQPKVDCKTLAPIGAESLIRWNHPTKGVVMPQSFIQAAERFGLINEITDWVIDTACSTIAHAKQSNIDLKLSVNLSSHAFRNPSLVKDILKTIKYYDVDNSAISFEIKETLAIKNQTQFKLLLEKFNEAGIRVVLDDFGLHPIDLTYLQALDVKELKLDKVFVSVINENKSSRELINGVIQLGHAIGLRVVAEGVETELQHKALTEMGCDYMQGHLFSPPLAKNDLFALYESLKLKTANQENQHFAQVYSIADYQN